MLAVVGGVVNRHLPKPCVCVCVCVREREREREKSASFLSSWGIVSSSFYDSFTIDTHSFRKPTIRATLLLPCLGYN
jgi:hypothetical protein